MSCLLTAPSDIWFLDVLVHSITSACPLSATHSHCLLGTEKGMLTSTSGLSFLHHCLGFCSAGQGLLVSVSARSVSETWPELSINPHKFWARWPRGGQCWVHKEVTGWIASQWLEDMGKRKLRNMPKIVPENSDKNVVIIFSVPNEEISPTSKEIYL